MESTNVYSVLVELNKISTRAILDIPTHDYLRVQ